MSIEALLKAVPLPTQPLSAFDGPWEPIEAELGVTMPQDYKDLMRLYGYGRFFEFLGINTPVGENFNVRLASQARLICDDFQTMREEVPYPLWPESGGLLPLGGTDNADRLMWLTRGCPEEWSVVVWGRAFLSFEEFDCDLTSFLAGLATGEIVPRELPDDLFSCDDLFVPFRLEPRRGFHGQI